MSYYFKCPKCENSEQFWEPQEESSGLGCLLLVFGGWIPALLYMDATNRRVQCGKCGYIFKQPRIPPTNLSTFAGWILGLVLLACLGYLGLFIWPELVDFVPMKGALGDLEHMISYNPKAVILAFIPMLILLVALCVFVSWSSNLAARRKVKGEYDVKARRPDALDEVPPLSSEER